MRKNSIERVVIAAFAAVIFGVGIWVLSADEGDGRSITIAFSFVGLIALAVGKTIVNLRRNKKRSPK